MLTEKQKEILEVLDKATELFVSGEDMYGGKMYDASRKAINSFPSLAPGLDKLAKAVRRYEDTVDDGSGLWKAAHNFVFANWEWSK